MFTLVFHYNVHTILFHVEDNVHTIVFHVDKNSAIYVLYK